MTFVGGIGKFDWNTFKNSSFMRLKSTLRNFYSVFRWFCTGNCGIHSPYLWDFHPVFRGFSIANCGIHTSYLQVFHPALRAPLRRRGMFCEYYLTDGFPNFKTMYSSNSCITVNKLCLTLESEIR